MCISCCWVIFRCFLNLDDCLFVYGVVAALRWLLVASTDVGHGASLALPRFARSPSSVLLCDGTLLCYFFATTWKKINRECGQLLRCNEDNFLFLCCQKFGNDNNRILEQRFVHKVIEKNKWNLTTFWIEWTSANKDYHFLRVIWLQAFLMNAFPPTNRRLHFVRFRFTTMHDPFHESNRVFLDAHFFAFFRKSYQQKSEKRENWKVTCKVERSHQAKITNRTEENNLDCSYLHIQE